MAVLRVRQYDTGEELLLHGGPADNFDFGRFLAEKLYSGDA